jgi:dimethylhistidine N-methyltransferase
MTMGSISAFDFHQQYQGDAAKVRAELADGLLQSPARVAPKFFYDELGSRLFDAITALPEYYLTRVEASIFDTHASGMAARIPADAVMIDLGAGCCAKAARLFPVLRPAAYVAADISVDYLRGSLDALHQQHPGLPMFGLGQDFSAQLALPAKVLDWLDALGLAQRPRVVFYPGSSIGNFAPSDAAGLIAQSHSLCLQGGPGGGLLIGVDRVKPRAVLEPAYDDPLGVTAAFNRNLLLHVNRLLGADFSPAHWQHVAFFNEERSCIEMHLASAVEQTVRWPGGQRHFLAGQRMHTEDSFKWTGGSFTRLLHDAGFADSTQWSDTNEWFSVFWARA